MENGMEDRLAALERELHATKKQLATKEGLPARPLRRRLAFAFIIVAALGTAISAHYYMSKQSTPLPKALVAQTSFPLYYPTELPDGYSFDKGSLRIEQAVIFYTIRNGEKAIQISQQAKPDSVDSISRIEDYSEGTSKIGRTYRSSQDHPSAIIVGDKSLINLGGTGGAASDELSKVIDSLERAD